MHRFVRELITEWRRLGLPVGGESVVVAVSGGADSASLLVGIDALTKRKKLRLNVIVAHFDHGIREDSGADLDFVRDLAARFGFELADGFWKARKRGNLEQEARRARYEFLTSVAEKHEARFILTGHTMNDQAETFLMNLIRGSGPAGLSGISAVRELKGSPGDCSIVAIRPLLTWAKRSDTEDFCDANEIEYRRDPMNDDAAFRRVWIRKELIPMLSQANPKIVETLCRTANLFYEAAETEGAISDQVPTDPLVRDLKAIEGAHLSSYLRNWLKEQKGNLRGLDQKHIRSIERLIRGEKSGRVVQLPGGEVIKAGGRLKWRENRVEK